MIEFTDDAREYLEGYLREVASLAKRNGDDSIEIEGGLRAHIEEKVTSDGVGPVDLDALMYVLDEVGSPSEVIGTDAVAAFVAGRGAGDSRARRRIERSAIKLFAILIIAPMMFLFSVFLVFAFLLAAPAGPQYGDSESMEQVDHVRESVILNAGDESSK